MSSRPATSQSPPPARRRAARVSGDERERSILETCERLLQTRPLGDLSVDELARGAGISRSSFYFYFPSKEAVLFTLVQRVAAEADANLIAALAGLDETSPSVTGLRSARSTRPSAPIAPSRSPPARPRSASPISATCGPA